MSSSRARKSAKSGVQPPVAIKQEATDTSKDSLAYLIEDRVELVKQIFAVLDAKTIKSMAPEHLGVQTAAALQEYCLDELLGISNKRLLSIIDETKCPTDTEDSDSDVEKVEEHISLEEISSEEEESLPARGRQQQHQQRRTKHARDGRSGRNAAPGAAKPMTMLELLELQYRAAAIRSQLAHEPVTKIELDSDAEEKTPTPAAKQVESAAVTNGRSSVATTSTTTMPLVSLVTAAVPEPQKVVAPPVPAPQPPKVRLKRNFRQRQDENYEPNEAEVDSSDRPAADTPTTAPEPDTAPATVASSDQSSADGTPTPASDEAATVTPVSETASTVEQLVAAAIEPTSEPLAEVTAPGTASAHADAADRSRSPTPDVVPICASPPTFCISSESEGEQEQRKQRAGNYINMPAAGSMPPRAETEDEIFLRRVKETAAVARAGAKKPVGLSVTILQPVSKSAATVADAVIAEPIPIERVVPEYPPVAVVEEQPPQPEPKPLPEPAALQSDPEEGELSDDDEDSEVKAADPAASVDVSLTISDGDKDESLDRAAKTGDGTKSATASRRSSCSSTGSSSSGSTSSSDHSDAEAPASGIKTEPAEASIALTYTTSDVIAVDDDDEDIIDLGKDSLDDFDVDAGANKDPNKDTTAAAAAAAVDKPEKTNVDNEEDAAKDLVDSWDGRWARSSKVSKVMATARLGSKLRSKIKKNKEREANEATAAKAAEAVRLVEEAAKRAAMAAEAALATAAAEEGSVEQYAKIAASAKPIV